MHRTPYDVLITNSVHRSKSDMSSNHVYFSNFVLLL